MLRLGLVAAGGQRLERSAADQAHAVLCVAHLTAGDELEEPPRRAVRQPALQRHVGEIAEAVADHELRVARRCDEAFDRLRGMLSVGVDDENRAGAAADVVDAREHG